MRRMLLTSSGLRNEILKSALTDLIGTPFADARLAFIPTASVAEGGNHYHLANSIIANGLAEEMAALLETKVYVGVSAGSMIFSQHLSGPTGRAFSEQDDLRILGETPARSPVGLFDWYLKPHLNSPSFPDRTRAW